MSVGPVNRERFIAAVNPYPASEQAIKRFQVEQASGNIEVNQKAQVITTPGQRSGALIEPRPYYTAQDRATQSAPTGAITAVEPPIMVSDGSFRVAPIEPTENTQQISQHRRIDFRA